MLYLHFSFSHYLPVFYAKCPGMLHIKWYVNIFDDVDGTHITILCHSNPDSGTTGDEFCDPYESCELRIFTLFSYSFGTEQGTLQDADISPSSY